MFSFATIVSGSVFLGINRLLNARLLSQRIYADLRGVPMPAKLGSDAPDDQIAAQCERSVSF